MPDTPYGEFLYARLAAAWARGRLDLTGGDEAVIREGLEADLDLHLFKRTAGLPRVDRVLGVLRGLAPASLLDVGPGRGAFLWPVLEGFPELPVTAVDRRLRVVSMLGAMRRGGIGRLSTAQMDLCRLGLASGSFDVVSVLEVLEHQTDPALAVREAVRVARRFVVASVPSRPDSNPDHHQVFSPGDLRRLFGEAGAVRVTVEHVLNHRILVARVR